MDSNETRPAFARLAQEFSDSRLRFAAVYVGASPKDAKADSHAILRDYEGELAGLYKIKSVPRIFVIRDGQIYAVESGFIAGESYGWLRDPLQELLT